MIDFTNSCIVACHPDDEIIFFGSMINKVSKIFVSLFGGKTQEETNNFFKLVKAYPLKNIEFLYINQTYCWGDVDWDTTHKNECGIELKSGLANSKYYENYYILKTMYRHKLAGFKTVITHNPWGESEHAEHFQIFTIIEQLRDELNFDLYYTNYIHCMYKTFMNFADNIINERNIISSPIEYPIDIKLCNDIKNIYQECNVWTGNPKCNWSQKKDILFLDKNETNSVTAQKIFYRSGS